MHIKCDLHWIHFFYFRIVLSTFLGEGQGVGWGGHRAFPELIEYILNGIAPVINTLQKEVTDSFL